MSTTSTTLSLADRDAIERIALKYQTYEDEVIRISKDDIHNFRKLIQLQFSDLSKVIYFDFVDYSPYSYDQVYEMLKDFRKGIIKVNTSGNDSFLWGQVYNLQFRAIHDYIHCIHNLDFNFKDEVRAFHRQMEFSQLQKRYAKKFPFMNWELYRQVLRSEIVYQAAIKEHFKIFDLDTQKIILTDL